MKTLYLSIIAISGIIVIAGYLPHIYAPCAIGPNGTKLCSMGPIPVTIDLPAHVYSAGDTINVTGQVDRKLLQSNEPLSILFYDSKGNLVRGPEILAEVNGAYSYHLKLGTDFGPTGQYSIQINHDKTTDTGSWFMFIAAPYQLQINGLNYPINYKITSGYLDKISLNNTENSLTAYITDTMNGGQLALEMPRKIIDSKSYNGADSQFTVLVGYPPDMNKANFAELQNDSSTRTLRIDFPYDPATNAIGDWYVKIMGTQIMETKNILKSPLAQVKSGILANDVTCKQSLQLVIKAEDGSPACVKPDTAQKLVERGWATLPMANHGPVEESGPRIPLEGNITNSTSSGAKELEARLNSIQDVSVASIKMIPPYTPGGPTVQLTLKNVGIKSITSLKAVLQLKYNYTFDFNDVKPSKPLVPNDSTSATTMLTGGGFQTELRYPLIISGIANNMSFSYSVNVNIQS